MKEIKAIIQPYMLDRVCDALEQIEGIPGLTVSRVEGFGRSRDVAPEGSDVDGRWRFAHRTKLEIVVTDEMAPVVIDAIAKGAHTGKPGDGKIFVTEVTGIINIRTGARGEGAI